MKKIFLITITIFTLQLQAQKPNQKGKKKGFLKELSTEQIANLKTKKMVLLLDLTDVQQNKIYQLNLDLAINKKTKMAEREKRVKKPSSDEYYQNMIARLDKRIAVKKALKTILNENQYEKWSEMQLRKKRKKHTKRVK